MPAIDHLRWIRRVRVGHRLRRAAHVAKRPQPLGRFGRDDGRWRGADALLRFRVRSSLLNDAGRARREIARFGWIGGDVVELRLRRQQQLPALRGQDVNGCQPAVADTAFPRSCRGSASRSANMSTARGLIAEADLMQDGRREIGE